MTDRRKAMWEWRAVDEEDESIVWTMTLYSNGQLEITRDASRVTVSTIEMLELVDTFRGGIR